MGKGGLYRGMGRGKRTDLIHLDSNELSAEFAQEGFGSFAVGAVGFAEYGCSFSLLVVNLLSYDKVNGSGAVVDGIVARDGRGEVQWMKGHRENGDMRKGVRTDGVIINDTLRLGLCGGHGFWGGEEAAEEGRRGDLGGVWT